MILLFLLVVIFAVIWYVKERKEMKVRPPGPFQFPLLGSMVQVAMRSPVGFIAIDKLSKEYKSEIVSVRLGTSSKIAFVTSPQAIKYFYTTDDCSERPRRGIWDERSFYKNLGLLFSTGYVWTENVKFCKKSFRSHGFLNRSWFKQAVHSELSHLVKHFDDEIKSSPDQIIEFTPTGFLKVSFANLLCEQLIGKRHDYDDIKLQKLVEALDIFFRSGTLSLGLMEAWPALRFVFGTLFGYTRQLKSVEGIRNYTMNVVKERRQLGEYKKGDRTCFIDDYLHKMDETKNDPNTIYTEENLLVSIPDLFTAGGETTANWMLFAILLMTTHPEVQKKVYAEIKSVIGDGLPEYEDNDRMIYTDATIYEIHRWSAVTINLGPRVTLNDVTYKGMTVKKGTTVLANMYTVLRDKEYWGDPNVFRPERFIGEDGQLIKTERITPFGMGKRVCLGEIMARESAFIYLTTLIQRYQFILPEGENPSLDIIEGITTTPHDFKVKVVRRCV